MREKTVVEKIPDHPLSLKRIMRQAEKNVEKLDEEIKIRKNKEKASRLFEEGRLLYDAGDIEGAEKIWQEALDTSRDRSTRDYIRKARREMAKQRRYREKAARKARTGEQPADTQKQSDPETHKSVNKASSYSEPVAPANLSKGASSDISRIYDEALTLYNDGDYTGSLEKFRRVREKDPSYSRVNFYINSLRYILSDETK